MDDKKKNKRRLEFFKALKSLTKLQKRNFIESCPDSNIHTICEACHNISENYIPAKKTKKFKQYQKHIKKLGKNKLSIKSKRKMLLNDQIGSGVMGILASTVLPFLASLIA